MARIMLPSSKTKSVHTRTLVNASTFSVACEHTPFARPQVRGRLHKLPRLHSMPSPFCSSNPCSSPRAIYCRCKVGPVTLQAALRVISSLGNGFLQPCAGRNGRRTVSELCPHRLHAGRDGCHCESGGGVTILDIMSSSFNAARSLPRPRRQPGSQSTYRMCSQFGNGLSLRLPEAFQGLLDVFRPHRARPQLMVIPSLTADASRRGQGGGEAGRISSGAGGLKRRSPRGVCVAACTGTHAQWM